MSAAAVVLVDEVDTPQLCVAGETVAVDLDLVILVMRVVVSMGMRLHLLMLGVLRVGQPELKRMVDPDLGCDLGEGGPESRAVLGVAEFQRRPVVVAQGRAEDLLVALQALDAEQGIEGQLREPRQLNPGVLKPVRAEQVEVRQVLIDEVPLMGMLPIDIAEVAEELAAFHS